eukprot:2965199-Heterocapsa_arctica.AAC.2
MFLTPVALQRGKGFHRLPLDKRWDDEFFSSCKGLPWEALPAKRALAVLPTLMRRPEKTLLCCRSSCRGRRCSNDNAMCCGP